MPGRWLTDPRLDRLTDRAFRTFAGSLMYGAEQDTDGLLERTALRYLHPEGVDTATAHELVAAGFWTVQDDGYQVARWTETQTTAAQRAAGRDRKAQNSRNYRERQQARRSARAIGDATALVSDDVTGDASDSALGEERRGLSSPQERRDAAPAKAAPPPLSLVRDSSRCIPKRAASGQGHLFVESVRFCEVCGLDPATGDRRDRLDRITYAHQETA